MRCPKTAWPVAALALASLIGAAFAVQAPLPQGGWSATPLVLLQGFRVPESVVVADDGTAYVTNIDSAPNEWNAVDGLGAVSRLTAEGEIDALRWIDSSPEHPISSPKGMCILDDVLYATDITRVLRFQLPGGEPLAPIEIEGAVALNDAAQNGESVFVTDTAGNAIYRLAEDGATKLPSPPSPNGIAFHGDEAYVVSWNLHEVYTFDPQGEEEPEPLGLAEHFTNLDGVEILDDGTILVSDFFGNKISAIAPDHATVTTLVELECPADIGLDREKGILWVPQFLIDTVSAYQLESW